MVIPSSIAIIMDGNGRWAREKGLPRQVGHQEGVKAMKRVTRKAGELGVSSLTVYAFSTENWKRPGKEVNFLMNLFQKTLIKQARELFENNVKVKIIGRRDNLSSGLLKTINEIEEMTATNTGLELKIAFNYGGRAEILDMSRKIIRDAQKGLNPDTLTEEEIAQYLYDPDYPDIELLIRTGGDKRVSNFLLWQIAYAELYFIDKYWPDFTGEDLVDAIKVFNERERRFGGIEE
jgi:undecaprenyl diphosphate synthase